MKTLQELYENHTGKLSDKWALYLREYDRIFSPYREQSISILEIGVQNGGSLEIWGEYFQNAKKLVGCDINTDCAKLEFQDPRIVVVVGDATAAETQKEVLRQSSSFDVIIEDGSHTSGDIVKAFARYFPALRDGGVFIAEDLHCSYWQEFEGGIFYPYSSVNFFKLLADVINHEHWGAPRARADLISGFKEKFQIDIAEDLLAQIHSIEFVNSICIVKKFDREMNLLGFRFVAGYKEDVVSGHLPLSGYEITELEQSSNYWATLTRPPAESYQGIVEEIARLQQLMQAMQVSRSWRYTAIFRKMFNVGRAAVGFAKRIKAILQKEGCINLMRKIAMYLRREGVKGVVRRLQGRAACRLIALKDGRMVDGSDYQTWIKLHDTLDEQAIQSIREEIENFKRMPKISVVMPVYNVPLNFLEEAIHSVQNQIYENWELCIADDASTDKSVRPLLESYAKEDSRIKLTFRSENGHISAASNSALELATGEFVAFLDNDDLLPMHALFHVARTILVNPDVALIYSDEDKINEAGERYDPYFKSDLNYELLLAQNMVCHLSAYRRELLVKINGLRLGFEGAQDYDLVLRVLEQIKPQQVIHLPKVLYHWRAISGSTALNANEKNYAVKAARKAISEHLVRTGRGGDVSPAPNAPSFSRVRYAMPKKLPLVSIIIPTRDRADILSVCLESVLKKTTYSNFEVIVVDNGSIEKETKELLDQQPQDKVRVIRDDSLFNYSRLNNLAVKHSRGDVICLMNNDIEVLTSDWIEEMLSFVMQPDIGCVGAKLWYPDGRLQHGGVILGIGGVAGHAHKFLSRGDLGYFGRAVLHQEFSAVTAACLLVRRSVWDELEGLDESFAVAFNDVDFCLRVREHGYRNVWTPYAEMIHHESASRGPENNSKKITRFNKEAQQMQSRWGTKLSWDPAYSPNLTLDCEDFSLGWHNKT